MFQWGEPEGGSGAYQAGLYTPDVLLGVATGGVGALRGIAKAATRAATRMATRAATSAARGAPGAGRVAASTASSVRYVANSAGEVVPYVRGGTLEVSEHAARALTRRNVGVQALDDLVSNAQGFRYWHNGAWKTGYYDPTSHLFAGTVGGRVTTVMQGSRVNANYINNLRAARP